VGRTRGAHEEEIYVYRALVGKTGSKETAVLVKHRRKCIDNNKQDLKRSGDERCGDDSSAPGQELGGRALRTQPSSSVNYKMRATFG